MRPGRCTGGRFNGSNKSARVHDRLHTLRCVRLIVMTDLQIDRPLLTPHCCGASPPCSPMPYAPACAQCHQPATSGAGAADEGRAIAGAPGGIRMEGAAPPAACMVLFGTLNNLP
jgi:hypothetical protein